MEFFGQMQKPGCCLLQGRRRHREADARIQPATARCPYPHPAQAKTRDQGNVLAGQKSEARVGVKIYDFSRDGESIVGLGTQVEVESNIAYYCAITRRSMDFQDM